MQKQNRKRDGEVAEAAFLHKAMTMGLTVSKPFGDSERFDFVVNRGRKFRRVQVRSTKSMTLWKMYNVASSYKVKHGKHGRTEHIPYTEEQIDFLAVYLVLEDTWHIVPVAAVRGRMGLNIHSREHATPGPEAEYKEAWGALME